MTEYTPSTEDIEDGYKWLGWDEEFKPHEVSSEEFKRWLQKVKAEAWNEGQQSGAKWGVQDWRDEDLPFDNPYEAND